MKVCPSCESPEREFEITDGINDSIYVFRPGNTPPGYTVTDLRVDDSYPVWDFSTLIQCCECGEEVRAGDVLEPEPATLIEFVEATNEAKNQFDLANAYPDDRVSRLEAAIDALIHAKNLAARGVKKEDEL